MHTRTVIAEARTQVLSLGDVRLAAFSVPLSQVVAPPLILIAAVLGAWRLGADLGWTGQFFISDGLLSRHQLWFAAAFAIQASASTLRRRRRRSAQSPV